DDTNQFFESCHSCLTHNLRSGRGHQISTTYAYEEDCRRRRDNYNDVPMQSIVKTRDAAVPVFLEIGLDRVLVYLGERDVAHALHFARHRFTVVDLIDLDLVVASVTRARSEEDHER
ncbi:hypothetical protein ALC62_10037, partial [Cyphomyrmex costatus]